MRKLLTLTIFILLLVGCTKDPSSTSGNNNTINLSPPSWIIGSWQSDPGAVVYTFTSNYILFGSGDSTTSLKNYYPGSNEVTITDESSATMYKATLISTSPDHTIELIFNKISSDSLNYTVIADGFVTGPLLLMKQ